jgi:Tfp pilus assembly protein PilV
MTLIEVMLGMFVLMVVFGGALMSVVHVSRMVATAKNRVRAVAILNQKMEEMRALTFTTLNTKFSDATFTTGKIPMETSISSISENDLTDSKMKCFTWTRTNDTTGTDVSTSLLKVVVKVQWQDVKVSSSISAYSYFSEYGVMAKSSS